MAPDGTAATSVAAVPSDCVAHQVRTEGFAGPLDVLVKLVVSQEVDIWEVSLTRLVEDFVADCFADSLAAAGRHGAEAHVVEPDAVAPSTVDVDAASEFALLAATLIELKSRRLLPAPPAELDLEEELAAYGVRDAAVARLLEGNTFAAAARLLRERWNAATLQWPRTAGPPEHLWACAPDALEGAAPDDLAAAIQRVLTARPEPHVDLSHVRGVVMTVDEAAAQIAERLAESGPATFRELTGEVAERIVVVVYFLAVLELFGSGHVELTQAERFGDIGVEWIGAGSGLRSAARSLSQDTEDAA
ncbi:segregation and condensation protein A [Candidatus Poriferisodalis sp.]|uniref:segregation and condensation protein A n=1 Tax=Candidatus Poriferisodalis sp. TaxID=3101277 RepID=UPI003B02549C